MYLVPILYFHESNTFRLVTWCLFIFPNVCIFIKPVQQNCFLTKGWERSDATSIEIHSSVASNCKVRVNVLNHEIGRRIEFIRARSKKKYWSKRKIMYKQSIKTEVSFLDWPKTYFNLNIHRFWLVEDLEMVQ